MGNMSMRVLQKKNRHFNVVFGFEKKKLAKIESSTEPPKVLRKFSFFPQHPVKKDHFCDLLLLIAFAFFSSFRIHFDCIVCRNEHEKKNRNVSKE